MKKPEILAPVGGEEQLTAAVRSGADAVYFGASSFNARRKAENFSDEDFLSAVRYCRERGAKAYITLNTIIKDDEREALCDTLELIARSGADAVIIQDMGVLSLIKKCCPDIPVHASTQMAVHNAAGALLLDSLGFSRIVLARELSLDEIRRIKQSVRAEIEVFVHGAHCMSASGMCLMSSVIGARSGNRGLCAQPCRLNFRSGSREYALSLKDMCLADMVPELIAAGVDSLKIEGRMKRPEYVSAAVKAYKSAVSGGQPDISLLQSVFSRSGFTKGYAIGKRDISMFGYRTKEDVLAAADVLGGIANEYRNENPLVRTEMRFTLKEGKAAELSISDGKNTVTVTGPVPENALKAPLSEESAKKSLLKLGSTFYYCDSVLCNIDGGLMLRASDINAMRREACQRLTELRGEKAPYDFSRAALSESDTYINGGFKGTQMIFATADSIPENINADRIILPVKEILKNADSLGRFMPRLAAELPSLIYPENEEKTLSELKRLREMGITHSLCENIGAAALARSAGMRIIGGALLNVLNSEAVNMWRSLGAEDVTLSYETSARNTELISERCSVGLTVYSYIPLMHFRCCPLQSENGCRDCKGRGVLVDRIGERFSVVCMDKKYSVLYNSVPTYIADKPLADVDFISLRFTFESKEEIEKTAAAAQKRLTLQGKKTAGLYLRNLT